MERLHLRMLTLMGGSPMWDENGTPMVEGAEMKEAIAIEAAEAKSNGKGGGTYSAIPDAVTLAEFASIMQWATAKSK